MNFFTVIAIGRLTGMHEYVYPTEDAALDAYQECMNAKMQATVYRPDGSVLLSTFGK